MAKTLTIAGSDTSSGAGVQADLQTFANLGVYGTSVITAITAQNTEAIRKIEEVSAATVRVQINAILQDVRIDAIKIGMVYSKSIIGAVIISLKNVKIPIILDPIFRAGTGAVLLRDDAYSYFVRKLVPLAAVITPNSIEAERLADMKIKNIEGARDAAKKITKLGAKSVIIKGGHMWGRSVVDIVYHNNRFTEFSNERIGNYKLHGAGCIFSAALTAEIAKGKNVIDAAKTANEFVRNAIANAQKVGKGLRIPVPGQKVHSDSILASLQKVVDKLESVEGLGKIIPESQSNLVFAKSDAQSVSDIAGVKGRIVKLNGSAKAASIVDYGASKHVASAVLAIMQYDRSLRSCMNIKYDGRIVAVCKEIGLKVSNYDRRNEPQEIKAKDGMTVKWGIEQAIAKINVIPDVIYHEGDWGKEPMILVFGKEPMEVAGRVISILKSLS
jgi:hydroxymethylpyrimidine/phosphomethylpyrimidine kinase